jgi:NADH:ubiquinone oxidoreductase subunit
MLTRIFTWWNGATLGALFDIGRRGVFVGEDEQGNLYYEERRPSIEGRKRRYVIYNGLAEASRVTPDWHGWMHHTISDPPTVSPLKRQKWEKPHEANMTGTVRAYRPKGSLARGGVRQASTTDYEAWSPDAAQDSGERAS